MLFCSLLFWGGPTKPFSGDDDIPSLCLSPAYYSCVRVFADSPPSSSSSELLHLLHHPSSPPCGASASATQPLRLMRHRLRITFQPHMSTPPTSSLFNLVLNPHPPLNTPTPSSFPVFEADRAWPRKYTYDRRVQINKSAGSRCQHLAFYDPGKCLLNDFSAC